MTKVKIYGAGSIGNHYAYACYKKGWNVTVTDKDPAALERMRDKIFPSRYGFWDTGINLELNNNNNDYFDIIIIGTPPESHLKIAIKILKSKNKPKILQIEKPLCTPDLKYLDEFNLLRKKNKDVQIFGGYNHLLTQNTLLSEKIIKNEKFGEVLGLNSYNNEDWTTIFNAHFWLKSPKESYLGFYKKGGGALCEHSHALSAWLHYSNYLKLGKLDKVMSKIKLKKINKMHYDESATLILQTNKKFVGTVSQDVITFPSVKKVRIQFSNGYLETYINYDKDNDAVIFACNKKQRKYLIKKKRPDDFLGVINHLDKAIKEKNLYKASPISISRSIDTMKVIQSAFLSNKLSREIKIKI